MTSNFGHLILAGSLLLPTLNAISATLYVRDGAAGSGTSWSDAYDELTSAETAASRGDTIYVADGTYSGVTFNTAVSGSSVITIRKATVTDHGTETGWDNAYGDGQATIAPSSFATGYWLIDGQAGGGPSAWSTGHGFRFTAAARLITVSAAITSLTFEHVEFDGQATEPIGNECMYGVAGATDVTYRQCYIHHIGEDIFQMRGDWTRLTVEYCYFYQNFKNATFHGDTFEYGTGTAADWVIRWNWFDAMEVTYILGSHDNGTVSSPHFYGNLVTDFNASNGAISALSGDSTRGTITGLRCFNNTFYLADDKAGFNYLRGTDNLVYNNLWYSYVNHNFETATHDYNVGTTDFTETNDQLISSDPFTSVVGDNYTLTAATNAGTDTGASVVGNDVDMLGNTRGADGTWDRGAFEFDGTPAGNRARMHGGVRYFGGVIIAQ